MAWRSHPIPTPNTLLQFIKEASNSEEARMSDDPPNVPLVLVDPPKHTPLDHNYIPVESSAESVQGFFNWLLNYIPEVFTWLLYSIQMHSYNFHGVTTTFLSNVIKSVYGIVYFTMRWWFLYGPRWFPIFYGNAALPENDICAKLIGIPASSLNNGGCQQYIHQIVIERTSFVWLLLFCWFLKSGLDPTWAFLKNQIMNPILGKIFPPPRHRRPIDHITSAERSAITKAKNSAAYDMLKAFVLTLKRDKAEAIEWNEMIHDMRSILDSEENNALIKEIKWKKTGNIRWKSETVPSMNALLKSWDKPPTQDEINVAIRNFESFHNMDTDTATYEQVQGSSAMIPGWAKASTNNPLRLQD